MSQTETVSKTDFVSELEAIASEIQKLQNELEALKALENEAKKRIAQKAAKIKLSWKEKIVRTYELISKVKGTYPPKTIEISILPRGYGANVIFYLSYDTKTNDYTISVLRATSFNYRELISAREIVENEKYINEALEHALHKKLEELKKDLKSKVEYTKYLAKLAGLSQ